MTFEINPNFDINVSITNPLDELVNTESDAGYEIVLEHTGDNSRVTSLVNIPKNGELTHVTAATNAELLVLQGSCQATDSTQANNEQNTEFLPGNYLRFPSIPRLISNTGCLLFVKYNQFRNKDVGERIIDTRDEQKWLPGPVDGITIRPLHVFDTESIMLLRWQHACEFRPNLDPQGEEILVVEGLLQNKDRLYRPYSWIRNPIEDWRKWHGATGTLLYYKSGHFPTAS